MTGIAEQRKLDLAAEVLSRVMELDEADQTDVLAYVVAAWCYARDRIDGKPHAHPFPKRRAS